MYHCRHCCEDDENERHEAACGCPDEHMFVACDQACRALTVPVTLEDIQAAYVHWRSHANLSGCSHGR